MSPQLCKPVDINSWSFSPLPSPESPFLNTPLSSTYHDGGWNPFDRTFGSLMTPDSTEFITPERLATGAYNNAVPETQQTEPWSIAPVAPASSSHSASQTSASFSSVYSPLPDSYPCSPLEMQCSSGVSDPPSRTSTRSSRYSKRSNPQNESQGGAPTKKSPPQQRLRSTSTAIAANSRPTTSSTSSYSSNSPPKHTRLNHNQVEKQYRNRLNGQFETLLLALPREDGEGEGKKVSKAEVLVLARKHIRDLERDRRRLEEDNERLGGRMGGLKQRWVESGGVLLP